MYWRDWWCALTRIGGAGIEGESLVIGEAHASYGEIRGHQWVDDLFVVVLYAQVLPDIPVAIEVSVELEGLGTLNLWSKPRSIWGAGLASRDKVAALCLNLSPTIIL